MSGYASGIVAILCINLIFAYAVFITAAAGQLNLGAAGFQAVGAYAAASLSNMGWTPGWATVPAAMAISGSRPFDAIVLDLDTQPLDGLGVVRVLRGQGSTALTPVVYYDVQYRLRVWLCLPSALALPLLAAQLS